METEKVNKIIQYLLRTARKPCYDLRLNFSRRPSISDSKLCGLPYWDDKRPYPTDETGLPMALLAQINFSKHRMARPLPRQGLLQFFISCNQGWYGYDPAEPNRQKNFRIVYHPTIDGVITKRHIAKLHIPCLNHFEQSALCEEYALRIRKGASYVDAASEAFNRYFDNAINKLYGLSLNGKDWNDFVDDDGCRKKINETFFNENDFHLLGFPLFIQEEIKSDYDALLLQIPSLKDDNGKNVALWGDCGILKFFINKDKLMNCDFSDVMYNFDCY